eukprot:GHVT01044993.1.p1 GENE.GHVT01044993.1~~GHVT01044993.1.p1  ORF type:complete len:208 (+),score=22.30 GHVT01044993.1:1965-2588(+)
MRWHARETQRRLFELFKTTMDWDSTNPHECPPAASSEGENPGYSVEDGMSDGRPEELSCPGQMDQKRDELEGHRQGRRGKANEEGRTVEIQSERARKEPRRNDNEVVCKEKHDDWRVAAIRGESARTHANTPHQEQTTHRDRAVFQLTSTEDAGSDQTAWEQRRRDEIIKLSEETKTTIVHQDFCNEFDDIFDSSLSSEALAEMITW